MSKICVIGDLCLDIICRGQVTRQCPESSKAPVFLEDSVLYSPGMAADVALMLQGLNHNVTLVGQVGTDPAGQALMGMFKEKGLKTRISLIGRTTIKNRYMTPEGEILFRVDQEDIPLGWTLSLPNGPFDMVILSDYAKGVIHNKMIKNLPEATLKLANIKPSNLSLLRNFDLVQVNTKECLAVDPDFNKAANIMLKYASNVLITNEGGSVWVGPLGTCEFGIIPMDITDEQKVGLGDRMIALMAHGLLEGKPYSTVIPQAQEAIKKFLKGEDNGGETNNSNRNA